MFLLPPAAESATGKAAVQRTTGESEHLSRSLRACGHVCDRDSNAYYKGPYTCAGACFVQMQSYKARALPQPLANLGSCARETSLAVHGTTRPCTCHHDIRGQVQHTYCVPKSSVQSATQTQKKVKLKQIKVSKRKKMLPEGDGARRSKSHPRLRLQATRSLHPYLH
jgi:hypothetical protein